MQTLGWLDARLGEVVRGLDPERGLSFLEVSAYCFLTHLMFRDVLDIRGDASLQALCEGLCERASLVATPYRFDHG